MASTIEISGKDAERASSRQFSEAEAVALLQRTLRPARSARVVLGIGDDAAVLRADERPLVWTVDTQVEHVHFELAWLTLADLGFRAVQAAVSDLAAMAAEPLAVLASLILPPGFGKAELQALSQGQALAARALACPIVGGNIARGAELSVTTTALGSAARPLLRAGARPGDELWLIGDVGLAGAGLALLQSSSRLGTRPSRAARSCLSAWRRPTAQVERGLRLGAVAHAAIDVSDGLGLDASRLAAGSGVRLVLDAVKLAAHLRSELVEVAQYLRRDPLQFALGGGEDYALLAAGPQQRRPRWACSIGQVEPGRGAYLKRATRLERITEGFDHLSSRRASPSMAPKNANRR